jgi:Tripartite tricarboxylate transporter TctB family
MNFQAAGWKDWVGGILVLALGLGTMLQSAQYPLGTLRHMGPGFFPMALGVILAACGAVILLSRRPAASGNAPAKWAPEWRGWFCICAGIVAFAILGQYGGLVPATFAIVFISAFGDRKNSLLAAGVLAGAMTAICVVVFWWLLQVQFPLFRWGAG